MAVDNCDNFSALSLPFWVIELHNDVFYTLSTAVCAHFHHYSMVINTLFIICKVNNFCCHFRRFL